MFLTKDHFLTIRITIPNPLLHVLLVLLTFAIILSVTTATTPIIQLILATLIIPILTFPNISMQTHLII